MSSTSRPGTASRLGAGLAAGAAGTSALNLVTYLDMTVRGRPASGLPEEDVERVAERLGIGLGDGETADARKSGAGALMGFVTGLTAGVAWTLAAPVTRWLPRPLAAAAAGLGVMAATDGVSAALGTTDPRSWSASDWAADVIPHLAYGAACVWTCDRLRGGRTA
jgi:hypothetical protein